MHKFRGPRAGISADQSTQAVSHAAALSSHHDLSHSEHKVNMFMFHLHNYVMNTAMLNK